VYGERGKNSRDGGGGNVGRKKALKNRSGRDSGPAVSAKGQGKHGNGGQVTPAQKNKEKGPVGEKSGKTEKRERRLTK